LPHSPFQLWRSLPTTLKILRLSLGNRTPLAAKPRDFRRLNEVFGFSHLTLHRPRQSQYSMTSHRS
jgi:hypothetical protein